MKYNGNYRKREKEKQIMGEDVLYEEQTLLRHNRISALRVFIILVGLAIAFVLLFFSARALFKVETVSVEGNEIYTAEQLTGNCGISIGEFMFSFPASKIEEHIVTSFPYVRSAEVSRTYPSTVNIRVTEYRTSYVITQLEKYILIAPDLKVLEVADENIWGEEKIMLELPRVVRALKGSYVEFTLDERTEHITGVIEALELVDIEQKVVSVSLDDYFSIKMNCEDRFFVSFGKYSEGEMKLKMQTLNQIMKSERVKNAAAASVDITDLKQQSIIPYDRVEDIK